MRTRYTTLDMIAAAVCGVLLGLMLMALAVHEVRTAETPTVEVVHGR